MTTDARKLAEQCVSAAPGTDDNDLITFTAIISAALRERDERLTTLYNNANTIAAKWKSEAEAAEQRVAGLEGRCAFYEEVLDQAHKLFVSDAIWGKKEHKWRNQRAEVLEKALREQDERRIEDYRSGYTCGYSDAQRGTPMRDLEAAKLFFGDAALATKEVPDVPR